MPSAKSDRRSLARRVAVASALAAALGGAVAALAGGLVTTGLIGEHDEALHREAAEKLAEETLEELDDETDDEGRPRPRPTLAQALAHGLEDIDIADAVAAMWKDDRLVAGDPTLPRLSGGCREVRDTPPLRVCATTEDGYTFVLGLSTARAARDRTLVAWAALVGVLVGALAAGLVSGRVAGFSLVPLTDLRDRVRRVDPTEPDAAVLAPPATHAEVEELRLAVVELVSRLGDALAHARHFAAQAAHELRTPLATLSAELELMVEDVAPDLTALARVQRDVAALTTLVERLLVLASPGSVVEARAEAVDLADVVTDACARMPERVRTELAEDVLVRGDATLLTALVTNAVENALKFSTGDVAVRVSSDAARAYIDVLDDGPGIAPEDRARVFAPFYRSALARASGTAGHGVGLALIAHVAEVHGGEATIVPSARGLHLRVSLPLWSIA